MATPAPFSGQVTISCSGLHTECPVSEVSRYLTTHFEHWSSELASATLPTAFPQCEKASAIILLC